MHTLFESYCFMWEIYCSRGHCVQQKSYYDQLSTQFVSRHAHGEMMSSPGWDGEKYVCNALLACCIAQLTTS